MAVRAVTPAPARDEAARQPVGRPAPDGRPRAGTGAAHAAPAARRADERARPALAIARAGSDARRGKPPRGDRRRRDARSESRIALLRPDGAARAGRRAGGRTACRSKCSNRRACGARMRSMRGSNALRRGSTSYSSSGRFLASITRRRAGKRGRVVRAFHRHARGGDARMHASLSSASFPCAYRFASPLRIALLGDGSNLHSAAQRHVFRQPVSVRLRERSMAASSLESESTRRRIGTPFSIQSIRTEHSSHQPCQCGFVRFDSSTAFGVDTSAVGRFVSNSFN